MADVNSNININIDTSAALANIKQLQSSLSRLYSQMAKDGAAAAASAAQLQQNLLNSINSTGQFAASMTRISTTTERFTNALEKNKLSMGEYFRYSASGIKGFRGIFTSEFNTIEQVARERVKTLQTQYIKLGRDASGAMKAISVRPLALDLEDAGTKAAIAAQKMQIFNQLVTQGSTNLLNFGKNTQWAGRQLMVGFTIPLGIAATAAGKEFMKLEEQSIRFKRVYGDTFTPTSEADAMIEQVKTAALEFTKYGVAVEKTLGLAADAAAMGKQGADLMAQVTEATRLAVLGGVEQQQALETTTSLTNAFGIASDKLAGKINFLNAVENQTVTSIEDLTEAIPKAGPVIQQLGGDVEDLAFFLTAMKEGGINASEGANALKSGLASIINPTQEARDMLAGFGINLQAIVDKDAGNAKQMILDLAMALNQLDPLNRAQAIEQMFGKFQFARMSTLFQNVIKEGSQASRVLDLTKRSAAELAILSEREMKRISDSPMYKFQAAMEKLQASLAPIGEQFLKLVTPILDFVTGLLDQFNKMSDGAKNFTVGFVAIIGGIAPVFLMLFGLIANGAANTIKFFQFIFNSFMKAGKQSKVLGDQVDYMTQQQLESAAVAASLDQAHNKLVQTFTSEASAVNTLASAYERANKAAMVASPANMIRSGKSPVKKASGGIISGPGTGISDSIPAMLSNGEAIIPAKQVAANRGLVENLISGNVGKYAKGGIIENIPKYAKGGMASLEEIFKLFRKSKNKKIAPTNFGEQIAPSVGHSFPDFSVGGLYRKPDGSIVFVKPQVDERSAIAEMRGTQIAREAHGLKTPIQTLRTMRHPEDKRGRKFYVLESPFDPAFANPTGKFTKEEYVQQLVASLLRGDKDLSQSNLFGNVLADVGTAGVFSKASGIRNFAEQMPSMEEQAMINLLGVKGGAKRAFAEDTLGIVQGMTPQEYQKMMVAEIDRVLPKLEQTIASFGLTDPEEVKAYQAMVDRLKNGRNVDWAKFHGIHSAVKPSVRKFAFGTPKVTKKPQKPGAVAYDFDDTLIDLNSFLPGHKERNAKLPKEKRKSWGWAAIRGAKPMPQTIKHLLNAQAQGKQVIILTARPNSMDKATLTHLKALGIDPQSVKLVSRDVADKTISSLPTGELKAKLASQLVNDYDIEAFFDDMEENRVALSKMGIPSFDPLQLAGGSHMVPGIGNKDTVPALLTPGEAVIPKKQAEQYRPLIRGMITGNLPGFEDGAIEISSADKIASMASKSSAEAIKKMQSYLDRAIAKGVEKEFMATLEPILKQSGGKLGISTFKAKLKESDRGLYETINTRAKQDLTARAHIGSGVSVSPQDALAMTQNAPRSIKDVADLAVFLENIGESSKEVAVKHGLFFDTLQSLNKELDTNGADITKLINDLETRGSSAWKKSIELGGQVFEDVATETEKYHQDVLKRLKNAKKRGVEKLVDTETQAQELRASGVKAESVESHINAVRANLDKESKLRLALNKAENTAYEVRLSLSKKEQERLLKKYAAGTVEGDELRRLLNATQFQTKSGARSTTTKVSQSPIGAINSSMPIALEQEVKAARAVGRNAGKLIAKAAIDGFNRGAIEQGGVASPAKETKKVGAAHSEGFTEGAKEGISKARAAGESMASRNLNTNPAFGMVARNAPPQPTAGMTQFINEQIAKTKIPTVAQAQIAQMGGLKFMSQNERIMRDGRKVLTILNQPLVALQKAGEATRNGLISAGEAVKNFGVQIQNTATSAIQSTRKMMANTKQSIKNAPGAFINWYQGGEPTIDPETKQKKYGGIRGKLISAGSKFGMAGGMAGMGVSMGLGMMSGMGGPIGDIAGQLSGPVFAISSIASILQVFPGILTAMTGPVGLVVAGLAAVGIGLYTMYQNLENVKKAANEAASAVSGTQKNLDILAELAGTINPTDVVNKQREQLGLAPKEQTWGSEVIQSEQGQALVEGARQAIKEFGKPQAAQMLASQLGSAVASGILTSRQASDFAVSIGDALQDTAFGINVSGKILSLIGPDGQDVYSNAIEINARLNIQNAIRPNELLAQLQENGAAPFWDNAAVNQQARAEASIAASIISSTTSQQQQLNALEVAHQKRLEELQALNDIVKIQEENTAYEEKRKALIENNIASNKVIYEQLKEMSGINLSRQAPNFDNINNYQPGQPKEIMPAVSTGTNPQAAGAIVKSVRLQVDTIFKGGPEEDRAKALLDAIDKPSIDMAEKVQLYAMIGSGSLTLDQLDQLEIYFDPQTDGKIYNKIAQISVQMGSDTSSNVASLLPYFGEDKEAATTFLVNVENGTIDSEALNFINTLRAQIEATGGEFNIDVYLNSEGLTKKGKEIQATFNQLNSFFADGQQKTYSAVVAYGIEGFDLMKSAQDYFNSLSPSDQKLYMTTYLTVKETIDAGTEEGRQRIADWVGRKFGQGARAALMTMGTSGMYTTYGRMIKHEMAANAVQTNQANMPTPAPAPSGPTSSDGGGGGSAEEAKRTMEDVIADQVKIVNQTADQRVAIQRLTAAGLSLADAYKVAANAEDAALIANGANTEQIQRLTEATRAAEKATRSFAAAQSLADTVQQNIDKRALALKLAADATLTNVQKQAIISNDNLANLYLNPTFDPNTLAKALADAATEVSLDLQLKKITISGMQDIWQDGFQKAQNAFNAQENVIELAFKTKEAPYKDIIEAAQRAIQDIQNRPGGLDDLDADLQRISYKEDEINKAYDTKVKALDAVSKANDKILAQQKAQLTIADALTQGDIAAAAKAAQDMRAQTASTAVASERDAIEANRKLELAAITSNGMTREQIELKIKELKQQILEIEEQQLEPAQRQIELLERIKQDQIDTLEVLGKTKDEWDGINASLELANTKTEEFQNAMKEALAIAGTLGTALRTGVVPAVGTMPKPPVVAPPAAPARAPYSYPGQVSQGSRGDVVRKLQSALNVGGAGLAVDGEFGPLTARAVRNFQSANGLVADAIVGPLTWRKLYDVQYFAKGGKVSYMALGGLAKQLAKGTDRIPAMLSEGEFVMNKPAYDKYGSAMMNSINKGTYEPGSVYNYTVNVNVPGTKANADDIARVVIQRIKGIDNQRVRGNKF